MQLTILVSNSVATKLRKRASANGQPVPTYAAKLVEQAVQSPSLEDLLAPVQDDFAKSGMNERDLLKLGRGLLKKVRQNKKNQD